MESRKEPRYLWPTTGHKQALQRTANATTMLPTGANEKLNASCHDDSPVHRHSPAAISEAADICQDNIGGLICCANRVRHVAPSNLARLSQCRHAHGCRKFLHITVRLHGFTSRQSLGLSKLARITFFFRFTVKEKLRYNRIRCAQR